MIYKSLSYKYNEKQMSNPISIPNSSNITSDITSNNEIHKSNSLVQDIIFECQFALAMIQAGYDPLNDTIIDLVRHILNSSEYKYDSRLKTLKDDFEKTIKIWGYGNDITIALDDIDGEEIVDLYNKIQSYQSQIYPSKSDYMYIKTLQRALRIKKMIESMSSTTYQKYKKYHYYFDHIMLWINSINL